VKRAHITFFTHPVLSHLNVTLDITRLLLQRGYRVTHITTEDYRQRIEELGAETVVYVPLHLEEWTELEKNQGAQDPQAYRWFLLHAARLYTLSAIHTLSQISYFFSDDRPDFIIYDSSNCAGRFSAEIWHLPAAQICPHLAFHRNFFATTEAAWCNPKPSLPLCKQLDHFFGSFFPSEKLNIYFIPPTFQPNVDLFDDSFLFAGPCISRRPLNDPLDLKSRKNPIILVSATISANIRPDFYTIVIKAFAQTSFDVILSIGGRIDPLTLGKLPANITVNQHTSHHEILPYASLFVGTGGITSTGEALHYGVPIVAVPTSIFHADAAYRVEQLGLGVQINGKNVNEQELRYAAIQVMENLQIRKNVEQIQKNILSINAAELVATRIHSHIANSSA
jgi:UDP:flavonoid glycosyltransferase YjiC (YdhE family)